MVFWKNDKNQREKNINSEEYDKVLKRISEINSRVEALDSKLENIKTSLSNLRGKFNQRLRGGGDQLPDAKEEYINDEMPIG